MMHIVFKDGTEKECCSFSEQKMFKNGESAGWLAVMVLKQVTADEADLIMQAENIASMTLLRTDGAVLAVVSGYEKAGTAVIRYRNDEAVAEIQLMKTVTDKEG